MLQQLNQKSPKKPDDDPYAFATPAAWGGDLITFAVGLLIRQYRLILAIALVIITAGVFYLIITPRSYEASAVVAIESRGGPFQKAGEIQYQNQVPGSDALVEKLGSDQVVEKVISELGLEQHPELVGPPRGLRGLFEGLKAQVLGKAEDSNIEPLRHAVIVFRNRLIIKRQSPTTFEIAFGSLDPDFGATVVNALASAYNQTQLEDAGLAARSAGNWFQQRLTELKQQLAAADRAVNEFKTKNNIVETDGRLIGDQQLTELNRQHIAARAQSDEATARLNAINDTIANGSIPDGARSDVLQILRQQFVALTGKERDFSNRFGVGHAAVSNLRNEISEVRRAMTEELKNIAKTLAIDLEIAKAREAAVRTNLLQAVGHSQSTNASQNALRELETTAATYRGLYDTFLQRQTETLQQESFPRSSARLITSATPAGTSRPNIPIVLALSLVGGFGAGIGLAMVRELMDRVIRTPDQIDNLWGVECLAVLPLFKKIDARRALSGPPPHAASGANSGSLAPSDSRNLLRQVTEEPFSRYTEGIRSLKLTVDLAANKVVGVTSALPNEGKSTVAANLALLAAQVGRRAILVDCDLRNPSLSRVLAPDAGHGLVEVLSGRSKLEEALRFASNKLEFLPATKKVRMLHTGEILGSKAMADFVAHLRTNYDYVILDLPPLAPVIDARAALNVVDTYVFVVEWGATKIKVVNHALNYARSVNNELLGLVLNKVDMSVLKRFEKYTGKFYTEDKYYTRYDYGNDDHP